MAGWSCVFAVFRPFEPLLDPALTQSQVLCGFGQRETIRKLKKISERLRRGNKPGLILDLRHDAGHVGVGVRFLGEFEHVRPESTGAVLISVPQDQNQRGII